MSSNTHDTGSAARRPWWSDLFDWSDYGMCCQHDRCFRAAWSTPRLGPRAMDVPHTGAACGLAAPPLPRERRACGLAKQARGARSLRARVGLAWVDGRERVRRARRSMIATTSRNQALETPRAHASP